MQRDAIRGALQKRGILDENFQGTLADGSITDFGQDGSKLNTKAMNKLQSENPNAFEQTQQQKTNTNIICKVTSSFS